MGAWANLKCSGPSFPVGFSTSKIWRLTLSFMAFSPLEVTLLDAIDAHETRTLHTLCVAHDASRRTFIPQRKHCGKRVDPEASCVAAKICQTRPAGTCGGKQMSNRFTQYILIAMVLGIVMG